MFNFGQEITSVCSGTTCPKQVAQYHRNIQSHPTWFAWQYPKGFYPLHPLG
jgi:hypothetical protein